MDLIEIRPAKETEIDNIIEFITDLAVYEDMLDQVKIDKDIMRRELFELKRAEVIFALVDGIHAGFSLYFHNFSTFLGVSGIYIEDIIVKKEFRNRGIGKEIFKYIAKVANERNCGRIEWSCLDWNEPSIEFYKSMGAVPMDGWTVYRLTDDKIKELASK